MANTIVITETPRYSLSVTGSEELQLSVAGGNELQVSLNGPAGPVGPTGATGPAGPAGSSVTVDATIIDGSANAVAGNAVFDALVLKAPLASPTFTGTVSGITKSMVGLGNVANTTDANKPVSTAQQTALDLKANLISPSFTGQVSVTSTGSTDGIFSQSVSGNGVFGYSDTGSGVFASSTSGYGLYATSYDGNGAYVISNNATALIATTNGGTYHATFGVAGLDRSFIARVKGAFGWIRGAFTARIHPTDTITEDRTYTLPNASGTVALIDPSTGTQTFSGAQTFTNSAIGTGTGVAISGTATSGTILAVSGTASTSGSLFTVTQGSIALRITETGALIYNGTVNLSKSGGAIISLGGINNSNIISSGNSGSHTATDFILRGGTADRTAGNLFQVQNFTQPVLTVSAAAGTGSVGIGTATPANALHVAASSGIRVDAGFPSGALNVGADVNTTTRSSNVRKLASFVAPEYTNTRTVEFFNFDSQTSSSAVVSFGGRSGGSQYAATQLDFLTAANTSTTGGTVVMTISPFQRVGIGTTSPSAKLHTIATTEQLRVGYDASNYASTTVSSAGAVTFDAVGASAGFAFSDPVVATAQPAIGALTDTHLMTRLLAAYEGAINGNEFRQMIAVAAQQVGVGSSGGANSTLGMQATVAAALSGSASAYTFDSVNTNSGFSGAIMRSNILTDAFFHGCMFRVEANVNFVLRVNFGVGNATRVPPAAGVAAASARQWGVEFYYDGANYVGRMYWYDTSMNYGTPFTIPNLTTGNWTGMVYSMRMRQTSTGLLEFYINSPTSGSGGGRLSDTPIATMQATWTSNFYGGRHINFEAANGTAAAGTNTRIHCSTMFCRIG